MTLEEARSHIGQSALHSDRGAEAEDSEDVMIDYVPSSGSLVCVRRGRDYRYMAVRPEDLTVPSKQEAEARMAARWAVGQAALNDYAGLMIMVRLTTSSAMWTLHLLRFSRRTLRAASIS